MSYEFLPEADVMVTTKCPTKGTNHANPATRPQFALNYNNQQQVA